MIIKCPRCQQSLKIPDGAAGKTLRCTQCQQPFRAPSPRAPSQMNSQAESDLFDGGTFGLPPASKPVQSFRGAAQPVDAPSPQQSRAFQSATPNPSSRKSFSPLSILLLTVGGGMMLLCMGVCGVAGFFVYQVGHELQAQHEKAVEIRKQMPPTLAEARRTHTPRFASTRLDGNPVTIPPPNLFKLIHYPTPLGGMAAYVSPDPGDGAKHPVVIWIFGGFGNGIDESAWTPGDPENDQSAAAFREAGLLMMYPSFRGGNQNPGHIEGFYGEVDDVVAATDYVSSLPYIDPQRIYLGGHSTGGTLALMAAAASPRYRAVLAFGPIDNVSFYGQDRLPFDASDAKEAVLRSPIFWLENIHSRTLVIEGSGGNRPSLLGLRAASKNQLISFHLVQGKDHFSVLGPATALLAKKVKADNGPTCAINVIDDELAR